MCVVVNPNLTQPSSVREEVGRGLELMIERRGAAAAGLCCYIKTNSPRALHASDEYARTAAGSSAVEMPDGRCRSGDRS